MANGFIAHAQVCEHKLQGIDPGVVAHVLCHNQAEFMTARFLWAAALDPRRSAVASGHWSLL